MTDTTDRGCEFKEICESYQNKTQYTTCEMDYKFCDKTPKKYFIEGFCPMYDLQSQLISLMSDELGKVNERF